MVDTASAIAKHNIPKTIIITGAMIPYAFGTSSDGFFNLGAAFADYDNDGHLDVVLGPLNFPLDGENGIVGDNPKIKLFKNNVTTGNWLKVKLNGAAGPQAGEAH